MAYERISDTKLQGEGLDAFIDIQLKNFSRQLAARNADDEFRFAKAVLEEDISLDQQLEYRQEQLKRVSDDPAERKRIKAEVSDIKNRIQAKTFSDDYTGKLIEFEQGIASVDSLVNWLRDRKSSTTDDAIVAEIDKQLITMERNKFTIQKAVLENQTKFALEDKTPDIIDSQISRVSSAKNSALLSGNSELATTYDLWLQSLNRAKTENNIDSAAKNFAVSTMTGYMNATSLLDSYNQKITGSSTSGSFKIGGVTYNNEREFWTFKRDSYIADESPNGFFSRFKSEQETALKTKASANVLTNADVAASSASFNTLSSRGELQTYANKIAATKQEVIQTGTDLRSGSVMNQYAVDYDVNKAVSSLNSLKLLGGNIEDPYTKILTSAGELKANQVSNILSAAKDLLNNNPGMTPEQALDQAIKSGAGILLSPEQLATKKESDIAGDVSKGAAAGAFGDEPRTTVEPGQAPTSPSIIPQPKENTDLSKSGQYYKVGNDVFEAAGNRKITLDEFKSLGLNVDLIPSRAPASTPASPAPTPAPAPTPTTIVPENQNLSKSGQYYKIGTDVYSSTNNQKITLDQFKSLGLNYDLLPTRTK